MERPAPTPSPQQRWLEAHPYLEQMARFVAAIEGAAAAAPPPALPDLDWDGYRAAYAERIPLLRSEAFTAPLAGAAASALVEVVDRVAAARLPQQLGADCADLRGRLQETPDAARRAVEWLTAGAADAAAPPHPGLLRFLGWTALRHALAPMLRRYLAWREERSWGGADCPTCGAAPALAQLLAREDGARRLLACGQCRTRWRWQRFGCPYCGNEAPDALGVLELEGEPRLRIDVCERCTGYLKTYLGEGEEEVFLADWPTLHLDVLARERGFQRRGASLYESP